MPCPTARCRDWATTRTARSAVRPATWSLPGTPIMIRPCFRILARGTTWDSVMLGRSIGRLPAPAPLESALFSRGGPRHSAHEGRRRAGLRHHVRTVWRLPRPLRQAQFRTVRPRPRTGRGTRAVRAARLIVCPSTAGWYKATLSHNTVLVDRKSQAPATGQLECFAANDRYAAVVARCSEAYPGIVHRRALCQTPTYLLVFDDLAGTGEHAFDLGLSQSGKDRGM